MHSPRDTVCVAFTLRTPAKSGWQQQIQSNRVWTSPSCESSELQAHIQAWGTLSAPFLRSNLSVLEVLCLVSSLSKQCTHPLEVTQLHKSPGTEAHRVSFILENRHVLTLCFSGTGEAWNKSS